MENIPLKQAAKQLSLSLVTLRRYIKTGKLKAIKVGKEYFVTEEDIKQLLEKPTKIAEANALVSKALNSTQEFEFRSSRKELFIQARDIYHNVHEQTLAEEANLDANIFGYSQTNIFNESQSREKWGRFAPIGTIIDKDGVEHFFPDPTWIDERMLTHARARVKETENPITLSTYFDMIFEYSKEKDKRSYANSAIDNYLKAADIEYKNGWEFEFLDSIVRALEISFKIQNENKSAGIIKKMLDYITILEKDGKIRYALEIIEVLTKFIKFLSSEQIEKLITTAREGAEYYGSLKGDNRHLQRSFLNAVTQIYHAQGDTAAKTQLELEKAQSFILEADEKSGSGLVEAHFLEEALQAIKAVGDPENLEDTLKARIEKAYIKSEEEMKPISVEFTITEKQKNDFLSSILVDDNVESLASIGSHPQLIPSIKHAETLTKELIKKHPLQYIFGVQTIQQGRKITSTEGSTNVNEDNIVTTLARNLNTHALFLDFIFEELKKRGVGGKEIGEYLKDKPFFEYGNFDALVEGLEAYDSGKFYSSLSLLTIQVEEILRNALRKVGYPTMKLDRAGNQKVIQIADILNSPFFKDGVPEDLYWYFRLIMYDKRGFALRDNIAHGLLKKHKGNKFECQLILHLLLILASFQFEEKKT